MDAGGGRVRLFLGLAHKQLVQLGLRILEVAHLFK